MTYVEDTYVDKIYPIYGSSGVTVVENGGDYIFNNIQINWAFDTLLWNYFS